MKYRQLFSEGFLDSIKRAAVKVAVSGGTNVKFGDGSEHQVDGPAAKGIADYVSRYGDAGGFKNKDHLMNHMWTHVRNNPRDYDKYEAGVKALGGSFDRD
jgi:hypothetical protein